MPLIEHAAPNWIEVVIDPAPVAGAVATGSVATGAAAKIGAIHEPDAVCVHVAGKPRETHDEKFVVEAAEPAKGTQIMVAEPLR